MANGNDEPGSQSGDTPGQGEEKREDLTDIPQVGSKTQQDIYDHGYFDRDDLKRATFGELNEFLPSNVVESIKSVVGDLIRPAKQHRLTPREAKKVAKAVGRNARVKTVKRNGRQSGVVMEMKADRSEAAMNLTVWVEMPGESLPEVER